MAFCLLKEDAEKFLAAIRDGSIDPKKMAAMESADRRAFFAKIVGEDNAHDVNALLESKLLLKDQNRGMVTWAKKVAGLTEPARRDLISRIEKLDHILNPEDQKAFLADYASQKIGATVTSDEAKMISGHAQNVDKFKQAIPADAPIRSPERLQYGLALDEYHDYLNHLMGKDKGPTLRDFLNPVRALKMMLNATKGIAASFDNSFAGSQGLKMLWVNPAVWANAFLKSWSDMAKVIVGHDPMKAIRADVLSRPNAINGKYKAGGYALGVDYEEAFPSQLPEKIPVLGRLYKASEAAFNGAALRMRADYADRMIKLADEMGVNTLDPKEAEGIGQLVNSMTGRGKVHGLTEGGQSWVNAALFSVKFLKSNFDTLTMHRLGYAIENTKTRAFVRQQAATNLLKIVGGTTAVLGTANMLFPGSVNLDPRSSDFGKITIGHTTIDVTGKMAAIVTLAARLVPTMHDGKWGQWEESASGKWTNLHEAKFGQQTAMDLINNFFEGRLSPMFAALRDALRGRDYQGQQPTLASTALNLVTPLPVQNIVQSMNEPDGAARLASIILDGLGFSANPPNASLSQGGARPSRASRPERPTRQTR